MFESKSAESFDAADTQADGSVSATSTFKMVANYRQSFSLRMKSAVFMVFAVICKEDLKQTLLRTVLMMCVDAFQLIGFAFQPNLPWPSSLKPLQSAFGIFHYTDLLTSAWAQHQSLWIVVMASIFMTFCCLSLVAWQVYSKKVTWIRPLRFLRLSVGLYMSFLYIPVIKVLLRTLDCDYFGNYQIHRQFEDVTCFAGSHLFLSIISIAFSILLSVLLLATSLVYHDSKPDLDTVTARTHGHFEAMYISSKLVLSVGTTFLTETPHTWALEILLVFVSFTLTFFWVKYLPFYHMLLNQLRSGFLFVFGFSAFIEIISFSYMSASPPNWLVGFWAAFLIPTFCFGFYFANRRFRAAIADVEEGQVNSVYQVDLALRSCLVKSLQLSKKKAVLIPRKQMSAQQGRDANATDTLGKKMVEECWNDNSEQQQQCEMQSSSFVDMQQSKSKNPDLPQIVEVKKPPSARNSISTTLSPIEAENKNQTITTSTQPQNHSFSFFVFRLKNFWKFFAKWSRPELNLCACGVDPSYGTSVLEYCLQTFPENSHVFVLDVLWAEFVVKSPEIIQASLERAKKQSKSLDVQFAMFKKQGEIQRVLRGATDLISDIELQTFYKEAKRAHLRATRAVINFWTTLSQKRVFFHTIEKCILDLELKEQRATEAYTKLLDKSPNNPRTLRSYAKFLQDVKNDSHAASEALERADELEDRDARSKAREMFVSKRRESDCGVGGGGEVTSLDSNVIVSENDYSNSHFYYQQQQLPYQLTTHQTGDHFSNTNTQTPDFTPLTPSALGIAMNGGGDNIDNPTNNFAPLAPRQIFDAQEIDQFQLYDNGQNFGGSGVSGEIVYAEDEGGYLIGGVGMGGEMANNTKMIDPVFHPSRTLSTGSLFVNISSTQSIFRTLSNQEFNNPTPTLQIQTTESQANGNILPIPPPSLSGLLTATRLSQHSTNSNSNPKNFQNFEQNLSKSESESESEETETETTSSGEEENQEAGGESENAMGSGGDQSHVRFSEDLGDSTRRRKQEDRFQQQREENGNERRGSDEISVQMSTTSAQHHDSVMRKKWESLRRRMTSTSPDGEDPQDHQSEGVKNVARFTKVVAFIVCVIFIAFAILSYEKMNQYRDDLEIRVGEGAQRTTHIYHIWYNVRALTLFGPNDPIKFPNAGRNFYKKEILEKVDLVMSQDGILWENFRKTPGKTRDWWTKPQISIATRSPSTISAVQNVTTTKLLTFQDATHLWLNKAINVVQSDEQKVNDQNTAFVLDNAKAIVQAYKDSVNYIRSNAESSGQDLILSTSILLAISSCIFIMLGYIILRRTVPKVEQEKLHVMRIILHTPVAVCKQFADLNLDFATDDNESESEEEMTEQKQQQQQLNSPLADDFSSKQNRISDWLKTMKEEDFEARELIVEKKAVHRYSLNLWFFFALVVLFVCSASFFLVSWYAVAQTSPYAAEIHTSLKRRGNLWSARVPARELVVPTNAVAAKTAARSQIEGSCDMAYSLTCAVIFGDATLGTVGQNGRSDAQDQVNFGCPYSSCVIPGTNTTSNGLLASVNLILEAARSLARSPLSDLNYKNPYFVDLEKIFPFVLRIMETSLDIQFLEVEKIFKSYSDGLGILLVSSLVALGIIYFRVMKKMIRHISDELKRTKLCLLLIPYSVIEAVPDIRDYVREKLLNADDA